MTPARRDRPKLHLDASVVPVERALLARAEALEQPSGTGFRSAETAPEFAMLAFALAAEFRTLAEELHYW